MIRARDLCQRTAQGTGGIVLLRPTVDIAFKFYCPVRAALTFVGCDKSKQKRAFIPVSFYERVRSGGEFFCYYLCLKLSFVQFCLIVIETTLCSTEKFTLLLVCPT